MAPGIAANQSLVAYVQTRVIAAAGPLVSVKVLASGRTQLILKNV